MQPPLYGTITFTSPVPTRIIVRRLQILSVCIIIWPTTKQSLRQNAGKNIIDFAEICKVHDCRKVISQIADAPRIALAKPTCNLSLYCESYQIQMAYSFGIELWSPELFNFRPSWTLTIDNVSRSYYAGFLAMASPRHPCCWVCNTGHAFRDGAKPLPELKLTFS